MSVKDSIYDSSRRLISADDTRRLRGRVWEYAA
jgi:hypothetical protein